MPLYIFLIFSYSAFLIPGRKRFEKNVPQISQDYSIVIKRKDPLLYKAPTIYPVVGPWKFFHFKSLKYH